MSTNSNDTFLQKFLLQEHLGVEYLKTQKWSVNSKWFRFWIGVYMYLKFFIISDKTKYILVVYIHFLKPTFTGCHGFWKKSHCISLKKKPTFWNSDKETFYLNQVLPSSWFVSSTTTVQKLRLSVMSHQYQNILSYFVLVHFPSTKREKKEFLLKLSI